MGPGRGKFFPISGLGGMCKKVASSVWLTVFKLETISEPRRKTQLLSELNELFSNAEIVVVSHYKGLTVQEVSELRNNIRKAGAGFRVTKNRITRLALKGTKFEAIADLFKGPTAIAFANDPISACKACVEFAKNNEKLIVVGGAMGTGVLSTAEINKLATIPSMDELRAKIIGLLQAPAAQLARVTKAYSEKEAA